MTAEAGSAIAAGTEILHWALAPLGHRCGASVTPLGSLVGSRVMQTALIGAQLEPMAGVLPWVTALTMALDLL
jgi:hypothetical protein